MRAHCGCARARRFFSGRGCAGALHLGGRARGGLVGSWATAQDMGNCRRFNEAFYDDDELLVRASAVLKSQVPENWPRGRPG